MINSLLPFTIGLLTSFAVGSTLRIVLGMRLKLYFISRDSRVEDQTLIPITAELKKISILSSLFKGRWRENVEITLMDYDKHSFVFRMGYHPWRRFFLELLRSSGEADLDGVAIEPGKRYFVRTGMRLQTGGRRFEVLVTPTQISRLLQREFSF